MIQILGREWIHYRKQWICRMVAECCLLFAVFLFYKLAKNTLFAIMDAIYSLPEEVYCFLGIRGNTETGNILFFMLFIYMLLCVWNVWRYAGQMLHSVYRDEKTSMVQLLCGQGFSRRQLVLGKIGGTILPFAVGQVILGSWLYLWTILGSVSGVRKLAVLETAAEACGRSILVGVLVLGVCFLYGVVSRKDINRDYSGFVWNVVFIPLILGNLYKVRNIIFYVLDKMADSGATVTENTVLPDGTVIEQVSTMGFNINLAVPVHIREGMEWLDRLYWISPLSWMNPFHGVQGWEILLCIGIGILCVGLGIYYYERRRNLA